MALEGRPITHVTTMPAVELDDAGVLGLDGDGDDPTNDHQRRSITDLGGASARSRAAHLDINMHAHHDA
jgi:hypothetical protein